MHTCARVFQLHKKIIKRISLGTRPLFLNNLPDHHSVVSCGGDQVAKNNKKKINFNQLSSRLHRRSGDQKSNNSMYIWCIHCWLTGRTGCASKNIDFPWTEYEMSWTVNPFSFFMWIVWCKKKKYFSHLGENLQGSCIVANYNSAGPLSHNSRVCYMFPFDQTICTLTFIYIKSTEHFTNIEWKIFKKWDL